jgi:hypothetical protein
VLNESYFQDKILDMKLYLIFQNNELTAKYFPFLQQALEWGWFSMDGYIKSLIVKDYEKMTTVEKMMYEDIKDIKAIEEEIRLLEDTNKDIMPQEMAPFPLVGKFKDHYIKSWEYNNKFRRVYFEDTILCPYALPQETFDDRLRKLGFDLDEEIRKC